LLIDFCFLIYVNVLELKTYACSYP